MKTRNLLAMLFSLVVLVMVGCGGGGGGSSVSGGGTTVSGVASKGPIKTGHYEVFQIFSSHNPAKARPSTTPFFSGVTDDKGGFNFALPGDMKKDGIYIKILDGTYTDEATQVEKHIETEYPGGMRAAFGNMSGHIRRGGAVKGAVTPYTEMAFRSSGVKLDDGNVKNAKHEVEHAFGLDDKGVDIIHTEPNEIGDDHQKAYTNALGVMSQWEKDNPGKILDDHSNDFIDEIHNNGGVLSDDTKIRLTSTEMTFDNSGNDTTGTVVTGVTVTVAVSKNTAGTSNDPVTITATVKKGDIPVPSTEVKFSLRSGAGALSQKSALTSALGVATTTLSGNLDGDINVVTCTAGGVAKDSDSINIVNPNKPGHVILTANPGSGTTLANGFVTLTATVQPVSAGSTVADGTVVTFTVTSGTGTLSQVTATSGGVATARLASASAGATTVTAKAGTATSTPLSVNFASQPSKAILKLSTTGVPAGTLVGAIDVTAFFPAGVTVGKNPDGTPVTGVAAGSGAALGVGVTANANVTGQLRAALATTSGFAGGEFLTITCDVAPGTIPAATDFQAPLLNGSVLNTAVQPIAGAGVSLSVSFQ